MPVQAVNWPEVLSIGALWSIHRCFHSTLGFSRIHCHLVLQTGTMDNAICVPGHTGVLRQTSLEDIQRNSYDITKPILHT